MGSRTRQQALAARAIQRALTYVGDEVRGGRTDRDLSQASVGSFAGVSRSMVSRAERALLPNLTIAQASNLLASLGLRLSVKAYPAGDPIRDAPQQGLLAAFRNVLAPSVRWRREVVFDSAGDLRAWDAEITGRGWRYGVEAETRPNDVQALLRRLAIKVRDAGVGGVMLVLRDTPRNRRVIAEHTADFAAAFPVPGAVARARLAAGEDPGGSAVILVPTAASVVSRRAPVAGTTRRARIRPAERRDGSPDAA